MIVRWLIRLSLSVYVPVQHGNYRCERCECGRCVSEWVSGYVGLVLGLSFRVIRMLKLGLGLLGG